MKLGIDVSYAQGKIDWDTVKKSVDYAIIRCGYGDDIASQDDNWWARNVTEAERVGIPYGVYLYSYVDSEAHLQSEIAHTLRLISGHKPFCVYLDLEGGISRQGKASLTTYAKRWCAAIQSAGYRAGVYASGSWWDNYVDIYDIYNSGYSVWVAQYGPQPHWDAVNYDIWQFTSDGTVKGISGRVDLDRLYNEELLSGNNYKGYLDSADRFRATGWAYNGRNDNSVDVHVYAYRNNSYADGDIIFLGAASADEYRDDLKENNVGDGKHGFSLDYNLATSGEGKYVMRAYVADGYLPLSGECYVNVTAEDMVEPEPEQPVEDDTGEGILATLKKLIRQIINWAFGRKDDEE